MTQTAAGLGPGRPSRTSIMVAAARAFGAREPDPSVRNPDHLAERFLGPAERELIREHPLAAALEGDYHQGRQNMEVANTTNLMLVRTRFIDEHLLRALERGATQVVILGAGFDTRGYRFQDQLLGRRFFEVDHRGTQEFKKRRVTEVLGSPPDHVTYVEIDFQKDKLADVLHRAGYQSSAQTFFIWEGVCMYLKEEAVRETLQFVATESAAGSSLVLDYACRATLDALNRFPNHPSHRFSTHWGEPWLFGMPDNREREFFRECGLELRESMSLVRGREQQRYLTRADGTRLSRGRPRGPRASGNGEKRGPLGQLAAITKMLSASLPFIWLGLTRRTQWYALAEVVAPARNGSILEKKF
jgi:methyltransferase (TIGR00027 family)